jgi:pilus assembly protein CpaF
MAIPGRPSGAQPPQSSTFRGTEPSRNQQAYAQVREKVQRRLLTELSPTVSADNPEVVRRTLERIFNETLLEDGLPLSRTERADLFEQIVADVLGYGPIEPLLKDDSITEVLVNGPEQVYIERDGILRETDVRFRSSAEVLRIIDRIVSPL